MRFKWSPLGVTGRSFVASCADQSQSARVTQDEHGWHAQVRCGVTSRTVPCGPFADVEAAKRWCQETADQLRGGDLNAPISEDKIVYLVVTVGGGVDGRDASDKGGSVVLATFDKAEATARLDGWTKLETKVVDLHAEYKRVLHKMSEYDKLVLGIGSARRAPRREWDHLEGNRG